METGFMLLFLAWGVYLFQAEGDPWLARGWCWTGLMWTRPDGCVYIAALALANLAFTAGSRRQLFGSLLKSAAVCTAGYLPWFAFAWWYYGSPVPHTIVAKSIYHTRDYASYVIGTLGNLHHTFVTKNSRIFGPIYYLYFPGWPWWVDPFAQSLVVLCSGYWLLPVSDRLGRMASLCFALLCLYNAFVPVIFPWYMPPVSMLGGVVVAQAGSSLANAIGRYLPIGRVLVTGFLGLVLVGMADLWFLTAQEIRVQQRVIEDEHRQQIGLWLKEKVRPGELVFLEPLGYIGYFSGARVADFPGLLSPDVVRLRKEKGFDFEHLIPELRPDWVVTRPVSAMIMLNDSALRENYQVERVFDVQPKLAGYPLLPGREFLVHDAVYIVFRKKTTEG
jgi:hypothetical protein